MILIPQRLFDDARVRTLLRAGNRAWLHKRLTTPTLDREGYVSNHAVSIVLAGEQRIRPYEAPTLGARAGEVLLLARGMYHITDLLPADGAFVSVLCYFDDTDIQTFLSRTAVSQFDRTPPPAHLWLGARPGVVLFARTLVELYGRDAPTGDPLLASKTQELLYLLARAYGERPFAHFLFNLTLPRRRRLVDFLEQNYAKPLRVEDYAYLTGRSLSSFRRDCQAQLGQSPQSWLLDRRMALAKQLLHDPERPVADVAAEVGYTYPGNFVRAFRKRTGMPPTAYQQQINK